MRRPIVGGNESGLRIMRGGLFNDAIEHMVGLGASYYRTGSFSAPKFRNGFYFYDIGGDGAISLGNVISGPSSLYHGSMPTLEQHERKHFMEQSMLGQYYLAVQGIVAGLFQLTGGNVPPYFDCSPLIATTYNELGIHGC